MIHKLRVPDGMELRNFVLLGDLMRTAASISDALVLIGTKMASRDHNGRETAQRPNGKIRDGAELCSVSGLRTPGLKHEQTFAERRGWLAQLPE